MDEIARNPFSILTKGTLILDEPSNGLDPAGQLDMRALIRVLPATAVLTLGLYLVVGLAIPALLIRRRDI
jgi:ABC-type transporter Mla maintaining outer membrane lipid asymmetry ATPase subunit MlaF